MDKTNKQLYIRNLGFPVSDYMDVTNDYIIKHKGILV